MSPTQRAPSGGGLSATGRFRPGAVVELAAVSVSVERTPVLRDVSLTVAAGEAVGVMGANGSGKSTLLRLLGTLLPPASGAGRVLGAPLDSRSRESVRPRIGLIGHTAALYPRLTLAENLRFFCRLTGLDTSAAETALEAVGLARAGDRPADRCSHGMQRRAELARVMLSRPTLLLLDEPHAGLDHGSTGLVDVVIAEVTGRGGAVVVVSHDHLRLQTAVDRIVELRDGALVDIAPPAPGQLRAGIR